MIMYYSEKQPVINRENALMSNLDPSKLAESTDIVSRTNIKDCLSEKEVAERKEVRKNT